jgi:lysophospholipid acyltransferase (LPLAT)-like uncharacterized protein
MDSVVDLPTKPQQPPRRKRSSGVVVPHSAYWYQHVAAWLLSTSLRALNLTIRFRWDDRSGFFEQPNGPAIYCFWHNRLALCTGIYDRFIRKRNPTAGVAGLVSASKDGGFLASILESFGAQPVRGSSSRRGAQALLELTTWAERRYDLAITPDGPRGPRYVVQEGPIALAQLTGLPIIPISCQLSRKLQLKSWDRFQIPLPFASCDIRVSPPIRVPREANDQQREQLRALLQEDLVRLSGE